MKQKLKESIKDFIKSKGVKSFRKSNLYIKQVDKSFTEFEKYKCILFDQLETISDDELYSFLNSDTLQIAYISSNQYHYLVFKCPNGGKWNTGYYKNGYLEAQESKFYEQNILPIIRDMKISSVLS